MKTFFAQCCANRKLNPIDSTHHTLSIYDRRMRQIRRSMFTFRLKTSKSTNWISIWSMIIARHFNFPSIFSWQCKNIFTFREIFWFCFILKAQTISPVCVVIRNPAFEMSDSWVWTQHFARKSSYPMPSNIYWKPPSTLLTYNRSQNRSFLIWAVVGSTWQTCCSVYRC